MKVNNSYILVLIIVVATIFRVYDLFNIPFTHDEFSALFRLEFDNIQDLIAYGARIDGHPAGVHVFLYYWTMLFGKSEWVVKLPFLIFGIASIWFVFKIGKQWKNQTVGLATAAFMAVSQFTVMYSQIARPYISGLFFSLVMVFFWSRLILKPERNFNRNALGFILGAALCTYNHHFSMLFAVIVGVTGLFYLERRYILRYLLSGLIVFILYIPHLEILFFQLQKGGVEGWLAKPQYDFLWEFVQYMFNYSWLLLATLVGLIIYGLSDLKPFRIKSYVLFAVFFFVPFLIGFFYSVYVNSVLQFSVLIFSAPYLYLILFGHLRAFSFKKNVIMVCSILIIGGVSLVFGREHYSIFYKDHFKHSLTDLQGARSNNGSLPAIIDARKDIVRYYAQKASIDTNFRWYTSFNSPAELHQYVIEKSKSNEYFYLGANSSNDPFVEPMIQEYFPYLVWQKDYFIGTNYLFSKRKKESVQNRTVISHVDFSKNNANKNWDVFPRESIKNGSFFVNGDMEWTPSFVADLSDVVNHENDFIDIVVKFSSKKPIKEVFLVTEVSKNDKQLHWNGIPLEQFNLRDSLNTECIAFASIKLSDIPDAIEGKMKIYIWNKGLNTFKIKALKIYQRKGNPIIYGLFNDLK